MNPLERMVRSREDVLEALREHREQVKAFAKANRDWHRERAKSYLKAVGTIPEREAHREIETADLRFTRDLADGLLTSALEAVRAAREDRQVWRSYVSASKEGVAFAQEEEIDA